MQAYFVDPARRTATRGSNTRFLEMITLMKQTTTERNSRSRQALSLLRNLYLRSMLSGKDREGTRRLSQVPRSVAATLRPTIHAICILQRLLARRKKHPAVRKQSEHCGLSCARPERRSLTIEPRYGGSELLILKSFRSTNFASVRLLAGRAQLPAGARRISMYLESCGYNRVWDLGIDVTHVLERVRQHLSKSGLAQAWFGVAEARDYDARFMLLRRRATLH